MNQFKPLLKVYTLYFFGLLGCCLTVGCSKAVEVDVKGELKKWHPIELTFTGPESDEMAEDNPFLNYRLDATFTNGSKKYLVPGFFAADGNAAETGSSAGNKWKVRFSPDTTGVWSYKISFKKGNNIAVADNPNSAESAGFMDGYTSNFTITETDKKGIDNRSKGRLTYTGEPYLQFAETKAYFIKVGVDAPENLLAFEDIDETPNVFIQHSTEQDVFTN